MVTRRRLRVAFVLASPRIKPLPSTRISVVNLLPQLHAAGIETLIAFEPEHPTERPDIGGLTAQLQGQRIDIVYLQKVHGAAVLDEVARLRAAGMRCVWGVCDLVDDAMVAACDSAVVVTEFLRAQYRAELRGRIHVVHDSIEQPLLQLQPQQPAATSHVGRQAPLRAALVTSSAMREIPAIGRLPRDLEITVIGNYPAVGSPAGPWRERLRRAWQGIASRRRRALAPLLPPRFRALPWHPQGVYTALLQTDIGIIPVDMAPDPLPGRDVSYWQVKSENRLTLKMALGLPVVASPVPSYLSVIEHGVNGFLAHTPADWRHALQALQDPALRARVGQKARASVIERFSIETQGLRLADVLQACAHDLQ